MPSSSLEHWDGSHSKSPPWLPQANSEQLTSVLVGRKPQNSTSKPRFDASMEAHIIERVSKEGFIPENRAEGSKTSETHQATSVCLHGSQSFTQMSLVKGNLDEHDDFDLPSVSMRALELRYLGQVGTFSGPTTHASIGERADGRVTHQRTAHVSSDTNHSSTLHASRLTQTNPVMDSWSNDEGGASSATVFDVLMTDTMYANQQQTYNSNPTHDITTIFNDKMDTIYAQNLELESHYPTTIDSRFLWEPPVNSPALSLDIPTDVFFTPTPSERDDSVPSSSLSTRPRSQRKFFSHVAVPPFPKGYGRSGHQRITHPGQAETHSSLGDALQAAMNNNGALYTISQKQRKPKRLLPSDPSTSEVPEKKSRKKTGEILKKIVEHQDSPYVDVNTSGRPVASSTTRGVTNVQRHEFGSPSYDPNNDIVDLIICAFTDNSLEVVEANISLVLRGGKRRSLSLDAQEEHADVVKGEQGYAFLEKCSHGVCKSLENIEGDLATGDCFVDFEDIEPYEPAHGDDEGEDDDDDDEIMFLGHTVPSQPTKPSEARSRISKSLIVSRRPVRVETSVDEVQILSPKLPRPKQKPKPVERRDSVTGTATSLSHKPNYTLQSRHRKLSSPRPIHHDDGDVHPLPEARKHEGTDNGDEHRPSAKALGKRRARSPESEGNCDVGFAQVGPRTRTAAPGTVDLLHQMNNFISDALTNYALPVLDSSIHLSFADDQSISPSRYLPPSQNHSKPPPSNSPPTTVSNQPPDLTSPSVTLSNSANDFLTSHTSPSPFLPHASDADTFLSGPYQRNPDFPIIEVNKQDKAFIDSLAEWTSGTSHGLDVQTIDPYLLGGSLLEDDEIVVPRAPLLTRPSKVSPLLALAAYGTGTSSTPSHSPFSVRFSSPPNQLLSPQSLERPSPHSATPSPSPSSRTSYSLSPSLSERSKSSPEPTAPQPPIPSQVHKNIPSTFVSPQRAYRNTYRPLREGMVPTEQMVLSGDSDDEWVLSGGKHSRKKRKSDRRQSWVNAKNNPAPRLSDTIQKPSVKRSSVPWPTESEESYCHQCRNKTFRLKYVCDCNKRYCIRCLTEKYEESAYKFPRSTFTCPYCENLCTCDICCRKRGDIFVSAKKIKGKPEVTVLSTRQTQPIRRHLPTSAVTRPRLGGKTNLPPANNTPQVGEFWGTVFGVDGRPVGPSFVSIQGQNADCVDDDMLSASPPPSRHWSRIFIGKIQESWGLKPPYVARECDPVPWQNRCNDPGRRKYIGNESLLFLRKATTTDMKATSVAPPLSISCEDKSSLPLSPLWSLDESDDDDAWLGSDLEGESHQEFEPVPGADFEMVAQKGIEGVLAMGPGAEFSPDSLAETDVARAISLGLIACGMTVKLSS